MATVDDLLERLRARGYGFDTEAQQIALLDSAYSRVLNYRRWGFLDLSEPVSMSAGETGFDLGDLSEGARFLDAVRLSGGPTLKFLPYQQFRDYVTGPADVRGVPRVWTRLAERVEVWPYPNVAETVEVDYNHRPTPLRDLDPATDHIAIPDPYDELVVLHAIKDVAFRERDWDARAAAQQDFGQLMGECMAEHGLTQRQNATRVVSSGFYEQYDADDGVIF